MKNKNRFRRECATQIAALIAPLLGVRPPKVFRINRRQGWAYPGKFSLPHWLFLPRTSPVFRLYYIVHETCHQVRGVARHHGPFFRLNEQSIMGALGYRLIYQAGDPYPIRIQTNAGRIVCDEVGRCV